MEEVSSAIVSHSWLFPSREDFVYIELLGSQLYVIVIALKVNADFNLVEVIAFIAIELTTMPSSFSLLIFI
jgi:hypothetical protein